MVMAIVEDPDAALLADGSTKFCGRGEQSKGLVSIGGVKGAVAGLANLRPPVHVRQALVNRQTKAKRLWGSYVVPAAKKVREKVVGEEADGTNLEFLGLFKAAMEEARKQNLADEDWLLYVLYVSSFYKYTYICCMLWFSFRELLFVHPAYQGLGVGRALLEHSQTLAELTEPLAFAYPAIYTPKSSAQVKHPHTSTFSLGSSPSTTSVQLDKDETSDHQEPPKTLIQEPRKVKMLLEASRAGAPVYTRLGFHPISETTIEYKDEELLFPVML